MIVLREYRNVKYSFKIPTRFVIARHKFLDVI